MRKGWAGKTGDALEAVMAAAQWLCVPLAVLLFAQWPLRDLVQAYSREANDIAQSIFAIYVSVAFTAATRRREHLAVDAFARRVPARVRGLAWRFACLAFIVPWTLFVLWSVAPIVLDSVARLERFPETVNPGYFLVKAAAAVLAVLALAQALLDAAGRDGKG
jgi:TRAP-type C4-dicarboxylate transport system permease small subunit